MPNASSIISGGTSIYSYSSIVIQVFFYLLLKFDLEQIQALARTEIETIIKEGILQPENVTYKSINDELLNLKLKGYIQPMLSYNIDHLVLGCTHYYFLKDILIKRLKLNILSVLFLGIKTHHLIFATLSKKGVRTVRWMSG